MHRTSHRLFVLPTFAAVVSLLTACGSVPPVGTRDNILPTAELPPTQIRWPARYQPDAATFFVHNEIEIAAPPQRVWDVLIAADTWSQWYVGAQNVIVQDRPDGRLAPGATFTWRTMDLNFTSVIHEFEPPYRLSWESRKSTIQGYHAWLLIPTPAGTRLVTDEAQFGLLAWLQGIFIPHKLRDLHDVWLTQIKHRAEATHAHDTNP